MLGSAGRRRDRPRGRSTISRTSRCDRSHAMRTWGCESGTLETVGRTYVLTAGAAAMKSSPTFPTQVLDRLSAVEHVGDRALRVEGARGLPSRERGRPLVAARATDPLARKPRAPARARAPIAHVLGRTEGDRDLRFGERSARFSSRAPRPVSYVCNGLKAFQTSQPHGAHGRAPAAHRGGPRDVCCGRERRSRRRPGPIQHPDAELIPVFDDELVLCGEPSSPVRKARPYPPAGSLPDDRLISSTARPAITS